MSSKRSISPVDVENGEAKRPKYGPRDDEEADGDARVPSETEAALREIRCLPASKPSRHHVARCGMQRAIAMVLSHDGFASATPEALESFTEMVETYLRSVIEEIKRMAIASRRDHPIPLDFELMMKRFNLPLSSLTPHINNLIPPNEIAPVYMDAEPAHDNIFSSLPLLGDELSGQHDKDIKSYIPSSFPDFPSTHTYRFTPQENISSRDSKKIREEAARTAQQGEDALRRLVRASKMRKQKQMKSLVERDSQGKERFRMWESTMKRFMGSDARGENADEVEIADHSMIVNGDAMFSRREVSRRAVPRLSMRTGVFPGDTRWDRSVP